MDRLSRDALLNEYRAARTWKPRVQTETDMNKMLAAIEVRHPGAKIVALRTDEIFTTFVLKSGIEYRFDSPTGVPVCKVPHNKGTLSRNERRRWEGWEASFSGRQPHA